MIAEVLYYSTIYHTISNKTNKLTSHQIPQPRRSFHRYKLWQLHCSTHLRHSIPAACRAYRVMSIRRTASLVICNRSCRFVDLLLRLRSAPSRPVSAAAAESAHRSGTHDTTWQYMYTQRWRGDVVTSWPVMFILCARIVRLVLLRSLRLDPIQ